MKTTTLSWAKGTNSRLPNGTYHGKWSGDQIVLDTIQDLTITTEIGVRTVDCPVTVTVTDHEITFEPS